MQGVQLIENHDQAYHIWRDSGARDRILVHIDPHHDMWWIDDPRSLTIANFICPALREGLVRELYWVVPDRAWDTRAGRRALRRHLTRIAESYPDEPGPVRTESDRITTTALGRTFVVCPLGSLPEFSEPVLLDVDTDYFVIPRVTYGEVDRNDAMPWCWPDELVERLRALEIGADSVTVAYSVEGGYTPLAWKYLGDEFAWRLRHSEQDDALRGFDEMRRAAIAGQDGEHVAAERHLRKAVDLLPSLAAPAYHLADLLALVGNVFEGRQFYQRAVTLDPSYRTGYGSGFTMYRNGHYPEAMAGFLRTLSLDPGNAYAELGLARLACRRKQWREAESKLRATLTRDAESVDAHRCLGYVLAKQKRQQEAISEYQTSLRLALSGRHTLDEIIATDDGTQRLLDAHHCQVHAVLARLFLSEGDVQRAIDGYRIALAGGHDGWVLRLCVSCAYFKLRHWGLAVAAARAALSVLPQTVIRACRRLRWHVLREARMRVART